jgi:hypothetical protein
MPGERCSEVAHATQRAKRHPALQEDPVRMLFRDAEMLPASILARRTSTGAGRAQRLLSLLPLHTATHLAHNTPQLLARRA